jgi:hypothetical protein
LYDDAPRYLRGINSQVELRQKEKGRRKNRHPFSLCPKNEQSKA